MAGISRLMCKHKNIRFEIQAVYRFVKDKGFEINEHRVDVDKAECIDCQAEWEGEPAKQLYLKLLKGIQSVKELLPVTKSGFLLDYPLV